MIRRSAYQDLAITGIGLITPLGDVPEAVLEAILTGKTAAAPPSRFDPSPFDCRQAAEVKGFDPEAMFGENKALRLMNQDALFAVAAARKAVLDSGLVIGTTYTSEEVGLFGATGMAGIALEEVAPLITFSTDAQGRFDPRLFGSSALHKVRPTLSFKILSNMPICFVSIFENLMGENAIFNPWESQGARAIRQGAAAILEGRVSAALVGGCDVKAHELGFIALQQQGLFAERLSEASGIVPGEGAVFLVLERGETARRRGARVHAYLQASLEINDLVVNHSATTATLEKMLESELEGRASGAFVASFEGTSADRGIESCIAKKYKFESVCHPRLGTGNLFAAAAPLQVAMGALLAGRTPGQTTIATHAGFGGAPGCFVLSPEKAHESPDDCHRSPGGPPKAELSQKPETQPGATHAARADLGTLPIPEAHAAPTTPTSAAHPNPRATAEPTSQHISAGAEPVSQPASLPRRRVVVTGIGLLGPLGGNRETFWKNSLAGVSGIGPVTLFDASGLPVRIGAEARDLDLDGLTTWCPSLREERDRKVWLAAAAAREAIADARLDSPTNAELLRMMAFHVGVSLEVFFLQDIPGANGPLPTSCGSGPSGMRHPGADGPLPTSCGSGPARVTHIAHELLDPRHGKRQPLQTPLSKITELVGNRLGLGGDRATNCSACAAGAQAIGEAFLSIRSGHTRLAMAGAADSMLNPLGLGGFCLLRALSTENDDPTRACRPFDATRTGTVLGEGGAFLVLEDREHALARGASIHAEIVGYGSSLDAFRVSDPEPTGRGALLAMRRAIADAGLQPQEIDAVSAHGTGTPKNDSMETRVIHEVLGKRAKEIPVHSLKSMTGHLIAASGAAEAAIAALTVGRGRIPPTINLQVPDPDCDLDYVAEGSRVFTGCTVLSNSFAFGGQNATLIFRRL